MIFIHNYSPRYTKKLIELGIAQKGDGFKLTQHYATPGEMCFNEIAKVGSEMHEIIKDYASCFYIDRLQGGTFYSEYPYNRELLCKYEELCDFLGFQLHELGTTRMLDWNRINNQLAACGFEKNEENIIEAVRRVSANQTYLHFSQGTPREYAKKDAPTTLKEAFRDVRSVIDNCIERTNGKVFNCDAGTMLAAIDRDLPLSFIEVGCQTLYSRVQYALRRGASRSDKGKWGAYLEPWAHMSNGTTCYCFMKDGSNEWYINGERCAYNHDGERGGSSMSYAKRIMYYSLFTGADYFAEEWGQSNTFYDFESFELSPYGKIKKEFCDFLHGFGTVNPIVPVAIIIPREYSVFNTHCRSFPYTDLLDDTDGARRIETAKRIVSLFYNGKILGENTARNECDLGSEDKYLTVGDYGSIFDIIFEDSYESPENEYELVIDLSGKKLGSSRTVDGWNIEETKKAIDNIITEKLPVQFESNLPIDYCFFESDGARFCAVFNHCGVSKDLESGESVNPLSTNTVTAHLKDDKIKKIHNICSCNVSATGNKISATLGGGEFILFNF